MAVNSKDYLILVYATVQQIRDALIYNSPVRIKGKGSRITHHGSI